jgi:SAM-dependent methyltransferase
MDEKITAVANSYDRAIELGREGIDLYNDLPPFITNNPNYKLFIKMKKENMLSDSGRKEIFDYLSPKENMKFVDLGCCLNLMFRGYKEWKSEYNGVDISSKTIELLKLYSSNNNIFYGSLICCSMHETPYKTDYFDIGTCIGSIEYFERDLVEKIIIEINRIVKPNGFFVLDIPDVGSPEFEITSIIEAYQGRNDDFNMTVSEFNSLITKYFIVDKKEKVGPMLQYFLHSNKSK